MDTRSCISVGELIPSLIQLHTLRATMGRLKHFQMRDLNCRAG
jgi:hypothetical protein